MANSPHPLSLAAFVERSKRLDQITEAARAEFTAEQAYRVIAERTIALEQMDAFADQLIELDQRIADPQARSDYVEKVKGEVHAERDMRQKVQVSLTAAKAARAKHLRDPKQALKKQVRAKWEHWQQHLDEWDGNAGFAQDIQKAFPTLKSQPTIEKWCREWKKEAQKPVS